MICGKYNYRTKTRCTRSASHVKNGMQHADNDGNKWPLEDRRETYSHLTPNGEAAARARKLISARLERMQPHTPDEIANRQLLQAIHIAIRTMHVEFNAARSAWQQNPVDLAWLLSKLLIPK